MSYNYYPPRKSSDVMPDTSVDVARTIIDQYVNGTKIDNILVAGCGEGDEAVLLSQLYQVPTIGIDLGLHETVEFDLVTIRKGDLMALDYPAQSFGLIYSYHVIEHVPDPTTMLRGLAKSLEKDGLLYIGFPNINRVVGYLGGKHRTKLDIIRWNINDYKMRLKGRFRNEDGAHAGFSEKEFTSIARPFFREIIPIRNEYIKLKYKNWPTLIKLLIKSGMSEYLFPANYFICRL